MSTIVFGTRLTDALRLRNVDLAGGTRIAESLHTFRRLWGRQVLRRGSVVIVISDGCETRDVEHLPTSRQYLGRP